MVVGQLRFDKRQKGGFDKEGKENKKSLGQRENNTRKYLFKARACKFSMKLMFRALGGRRGKEIRAFRSI
jgi:hypothetical protein